MTLTYSTADPSMADLREKAIAILGTNDIGGYTVPTASGLYPAQWHWDSCLVALGFAQFDVARGWEEIETLLSGQWTDGMIPHILFRGDDSSYFPNSTVWDAGHRVRSSGITQPPVAAIAVRYLAERTAEPERSERLARILPKLLRAHQWLYAARDPENTGLVAIIHPWESGMDNSPVWDEALAALPPAPSVAHLRRDLGFVEGAARPHGQDYDRYIALVSLFRELRYDPSAIWAHSPFLIQDIGFNSILMRANQDLAYLLEQAGDQESAQMIGDFQERAEAALEMRWSQEDGLYLSHDLRAGHDIRKPGIASFLPLFCDPGTVLRHPELVRCLEAWLSATSFGVPSYCPGAPDYEPQRYWRGPIWFVVNWMLFDGLRRNGCVELAESILEDSLNLAKASGFAEYFNPESGAALGGNGFSWTAAMVLLLQSEQNR